MEVSARHDPSFPFLRRVAVSCRLITSHPWSGSRSKIDILTCNLFFSLFSFLGLLFGCLLISFSPPLLVAIEFLISLSKTSPLRTPSHNNSRIVFLNNSFISHIHLSPLCIALLSIPSPFLFFSFSLLFASQPKAILKTTTLPSVLAYIPPPFLLTSVQ